MDKKSLSDLKSNTMACWWPSKIWPERVTDWGGILGELEGLREYQNSPAELESWIEFAKEQAAQ